jgi:tyrosyl-tRNA synthetase
VTVARLLERDDFNTRMKADQPISALELLYPVLQGYDSVAVRSDVEVGGTDQKFNLLFARDIQRAYGVPEQSIITMPILPGTDGRQRMSKSLGNYVAVTDPPDEMFGKLMSVPDEAMGLYYELLLGQRRQAATPPKRSGVLRPHRGALSRARAGRRPKHSSTGYTSSTGYPMRLPDSTLSATRRVGLLRSDGEVHLLLLISSAFEMSTSEARRLLSQGAVKLDGGAGCGALGPAGEGAERKICRWEAVDFCSSSHAEILEQAGPFQGYTLRSLLLRTTKRATS